MPVTIGAISAGSNILGGVIGNLATADERNQALQLQKQALANINNINSPTAQQLQIALQQYQSAGQLTPEMEATINQQNSLMNNISTDPRLQAAQMSALQNLQQVGAGGLRPEDLSALNQVRNNSEQQANSDRASVLQNMQQRGMGGGGAELAAQLNASQAAANRANTSGLDIAGQASQRALQAIQSSGALGGQMQATQFGQKAQQAQAQDIINRYNAMNQQQVGNQNTAVSNAAQAQNLANKQALMNANTGIGNQQTMYNTQAQQQAYQDAMNKAQAVAGQTKLTSGAMNDDSANTQKMWSGLGQAGGQGAATAGYFNVLQGKNPAATAGSGATTASGNELTAIADPSLASAFENLA